MTRCSLALSALLLLVSAINVRADETFTLWATGDPHVEGDLKRGGRESLTEAIRQSEGPNGFNWDAMLVLGDVAAGKTPPKDASAREVIRQLKTLKKNRLGDVFMIAGNHDGSYADDQKPHWFERWFDPIGRYESPFKRDQRRYDVKGTWERYKFQVGNVLFLMLSDYNSAPKPVGWGLRSDTGKRAQASGAITRATFEWWKDQVLNNQDKIIVTTHHHALRNTTTRSKPGGGDGLHCSGNCDQSALLGTGYVFYIVEDESLANFRYSSNVNDFEEFLKSYYREHGEPAIDLWLAGHSHPTTPNEIIDGQKLVEKRFGTTFVQCSALTLFWGGGVPMSRIITFTNGSSQARMQTYIHDTRQKRPIGNKNKWEIGFYKAGKASLDLRHPWVSQDK